MRNRLRGFVLARVRRNIWLKFAIVLLVLGAVVVLVGTVGTAAISEGTKGQVMDDYARLAEGESRALETWHRRNQDLVAALASAEPLESGSGGAVHEYIESERNSLSASVHQIHYVDTAASKVRESTLTSLAGRSLAAVDAPWPAELDSRSGVSVTRIYRSSPAQGSRPLLAYTVPVDRADDADRALVVTFRTAAYATTIPDREESVTFVVDRRGRIVFSQANAALLNYTAAGRPAGEAAELPGGATEGSGATVAGASVTVASIVPSIGEGEPTVVGYAAVPNTDWTVLVHIARSDAFGFVTNISVIGIGVTLLVVGLFTATGLYLGRRTTSTFEELIAAIRGVAAGETDITLETDREDRIGDLYREVDTMASRLHRQRSQLNVLNRVLRHNLRNDMNVIISYAELLRGDDQEESERYAQAETIRRTARDLLRKGDHAREIRNVILSGDRAADPVDVVDAIASEVGSVRDEYPASEVALTLPDRALVSNERAVRILVSELVRNGLRHNDRPQAERWVSLTAQITDGTLRLRVEDNGPGLPDPERTLLEGDLEESPLDHGSGLGLWVVTWIVDYMDGTIAVRDSTDDGTTILVRIPTLDEEDPVDGTDTR